MDDSKKNDVKAFATKPERKKIKSDKKRSFNVVDVILILMILTFASAISLIMLYVSFTSQIFIYFVLLFFL